MVALALAALAAALGTTIAVAQGSQGEGCGSECKADLDRARAATEKYIDVAAAIGDDFIESSECGSSDAGTLGIQYTNLKRASDPQVAVEEPESLIYMPEFFGSGRRLVGLEYSVPDEGQPPQLFGREFDGPEPSRTPGLPDQYVLRVWLYSDNPAGLFAPANPGEACDAAGLVDWDARIEECVEVVGSIAVDEGMVRKHVPPRFELQSGRSPDTAQIQVGTHRCESLTLDDGRIVAPLLFGRYNAELKPHDWVGVDTGLNQYLLRAFYDDRDLVKAGQQRTGVSSEVLAYSEQLKREFNPLPGTMIDPSYRFKTPDFVLTAKVTDPAPTDVDASLRFWRETERGLAKLQPWVEIDALGPADIEVTPKAGSLLAEMAGCDTEAGTCEPIPAETGLILTFDGAVRLTVR